MSMKIVQYLDTEFNLLAGTVSPYRKRNTLWKFVNSKSPPECVIKHIPSGVENRLSRNYSTRERFVEKKADYMPALKAEVYKINLIFKPRIDQQLRNNRKRNVICPPPIKSSGINKNRKIFFGLIRKHFSKRFEL